MAMFVFYPMGRLWSHLLRTALVLSLAWGGLAGAADAPPGFDSVVAQGVHLRQLGHLTLSIDRLRQASPLAATAQQRMQLAGELGAALKQAHQFDLAAVELADAYDQASGAQRAVYALDLGHLALLRKQPEQAQRYFTEARQLAGDALVRISAGLNLARGLPGPDTLPQLTQLFADIGSSGAADGARAALYLNLGHQAQMLGQTGLALAYQSLTQAHRLSSLSAAPGRLSLESLDALAQLYEDQHRLADALTLTQQALTRLPPMQASAVADVLLALEARQGRLYAQLGQPVQALAAYQRAADQIDVLRLDLPIEYEDGRSSFSQTLEPVYMGLIDALLTTANTLDEATAAHHLRRALAAVELLKQSEMQDYLGDRCSVDSVKGGSATIIASDTAVLYPIIFPDRIELLLQTHSGVTRFGSRVAGDRVRRAASALASSLRNGDDDFTERARQLYDWLLRPLEPLLTSQKITTLVLVPDGALRLVPFGALHDGHQFAIEKFAISSITGLSMTHTGSAANTTSAASAQPPVSLVAGASQFGSVVEKLMQTQRGQSLATEVARQDSGRGLARSRTVRLPVSWLAVESAATPVNLLRSMREALALPGVAKEVQSVSRILPGSSLLDAGFTLNAFSQAAESGAFSILHIASHGVFGGSAEASYLMAYDDLLTLDGLQALLQGEQFRKHPIELLSLSACETAQGNDRAPLGIAGAAIRARAKSVLGTLWPVDDEAAVRVMTQFYHGLTQNHLSKAQALRQAQVELIQNKEFMHPFFWAPFLLIGNWLSITPA